MNYFRRTLLVGLGGSGQLILTHVKRHFLEVYGQVPPAIRFLALDTDAKRETLKLRTSEGECQLSHGEFFHLKVEDPMTFLRTSPAVQEWFVTAGPVSAIQFGAGGIRQNGRLALFHHIVDVERRLSDILTEITGAALVARMESLGYRVLDRPLEVYVCGSLAGGTGSGCFLDLGILLRHMVDSAHVHGFFLLDWIYHQKPFTHRVAGNAYAALCELDYLQGTRTDVRRPYTVKYGERVREVRTPPYTLFHVLDGRNAYGENIADVGQLCDVVARGIFLSIGSMGEKVTSVVDNVLAHIGAQDPKTWDGRPARYSSYGVSSLCYPAVLIHRIASMDGALALCRAAQEKAAKGARTTATTAVSDAAAAQAKAMLDGLNLSRLAVQSKLCLVRAPAQFPVQKLMIADRAFPAMLVGAMEGQEKRLLGTIAASVQSNGAAFRGAIENSLRGELDKQREKLKKSSAALRASTDALAAQIQAWADEAARDIQAADQRIDGQGGLREALRTAMDAAGQTWSFPIGPSPRAAAVGTCCQQAGVLLGEVWKREVFRAEKQFYDGLLGLLEAAQPEQVVAASAIQQDLRLAEQDLERQLRIAGSELKALQEDTSTVLVGHGKAVVVSHAGDSVLAEIAELRAGESNSFYERFETAAGIHNLDDYSRKAQELQGGLAGLLLDYVSSELKELGAVDVLTALAAEAAREGPSEKQHAYLERQFSHLMRLASPLWSVRSSMVSGERRPHYEDLLVLGCPNADQAQALFGDRVDNVRQAFQITSRVDYMSIEDKQRIWLMDFSAALPFYFLADLDESKKRYEEGMTPPYHVDRRLEIEIPDLFPPHERDNVTLRHLAMSILPGVDVVGDEYLRPKGSRGHVFTCSLPGIAGHTDGEVYKKWTRFLDLYSEMRDFYDPQSADNLLDLIHRALAPKLTALLMDDAARARLKVEVSGQVDALKKKIAARDFSRLVSARLSSREVRDLREFLALMEALEPRISQLSAAAVEAAVEKFLGGGTAAQAVGEAAKTAKA